MKTNKAFVVLIANLIFVVTSAKASPNFWQAGTANWGTSINWTAGEPTSDSVACVDNGGTAQITEEGEVCYQLFLGNNPNDTGYVDMSGTGELSITRYGWIGYQGRGEFRQSGESVSTIGQVLYIAFEADSNSVYILNETAQLLVGWHDYIGNRGTGLFTQTGGIHSVGNYLYLGNESSGEGNYELSGTGQLLAGYEHIGVFGTGTFTHSGGTNNINNYLKLAVEPNSEGTYSLSGTGQLTVGGAETIGRRGIGTFVQSGGTNNCYQIYLGDMSDSNGTYTISGGQLNVEFLIIAFGESVGTFNISHRDANVTISSLLHFGPGSAFTSVPGATIHMTGSNFENQSTDPNNLMGLNNLEFIFEGGNVDIDNFEVGGIDYGTTAKGLNGNFAMDVLTLGGLDVGKVKLVDDVDNQNDGISNEALYVYDLNVTAGSYLDLNGLKLYYVNSSVNPSATIVENGGSLNQIFIGDFEPDGDVDFADFSVLALAWQSKPGDENWDQICNLDAPDDIINIADLAVFTDNWLAGTQ